MNDPTRPPGFAFKRLRLLRAQCEVMNDPNDGEDGEIIFNYSDDVRVEGLSVAVTQSLFVQVVRPESREHVFLKAYVELEGRFEGGPAVNLDAERFGNEHAPAILYAFTREWIHRLTSAADPWPPVLLPPLNVLQIRKQITRKNN